ncbi:DUF1707 SHOCT-like domain-containing protein [Actinopolymorpha pittospori]
MSNAPWSAGGSGDLRASDSDRDRTAEVLRDAAAAGRLDLTELETRLEQTFNAKTYAELVPLTADLPEAAGAGRAGTSGAVGDLGAPRQGPHEVNALLSEQKVAGRWLAPRQMTARSILGSVTIDFTDAALPHEVVLDVQIGLGQITLIVPDDIAVDMDAGTTVLASKDNKTRGTHAPGTPVIRVRGTVILGELVARPPRRRNWFKWGKDGSAS